jgi:hypothetical protein
MEHLLKLALFRKDYISLFALPKKYQRYAEMRAFIKSAFPEMSFEQSGTVEFLEAIERVEILYGAGSFDSVSFREINTLRNSIEHCWDNNLEYLEKNVSVMSSKILPAFNNFIAKILNEDPIGFLDSFLRKDLLKLDEAIVSGHSLEFQKRLSKHKELYAISARKALDD